MKKVYRVYKKAPRRIKLDRRRKEEVYTASGAPVLVGIYYNYDIALAIARNLKNSYIQMPI